MGHWGQGHALPIPLHPILVHFPIAFYFLELLLIVLWWVKGDEGYRRFAYFSFRLGYLFMLAAMVAGVADAGGFGNIRGAVQRHALAALLVFLIYSLRAALYAASKGKELLFRPAQLAGALVGNAALIYAGFLGGWLVYS